MSFLDEKINEQRFWESIADGYLRTIVDGESLGRLETILEREKSMLREQLDKIKVVESLETLGFRTTLDHPTSVDELYVPSAIRIDEDGDRRICHGGVCIAPNFTVIENETQREVMFNAVFSTPGGEIQTIAEAFDGVSSQTNRQWRTTQPSVIRSQNVQNVKNQSRYSFSAMFRHCIFGDAGDESDVQVEVIPTENSRRSRVNQANNQTVGQASTTKRKKAPPKKSNGGNNGGNDGGDGPGPDDEAGPSNRFFQSEPKPKKPKVWTLETRLASVHLPNEGEMPFIPRKGYNPKEELPKRSNGCYVDKFDNEWGKGRSITPGEAYEWDVQLSPRGKRLFGHLSRSGNHLNVSWTGKITH